jgi:hypothetical protein
VTVDEQDATLETEIAAEMTADVPADPGEQVEPAPDEEALVTGPGPESPFQPPELKDEDEDEDEPEEKLEDYAPGVAEARLQSEREAEALGKKLDAERKRHGKRVMELLGNDLGGHIPCPTCMDAIDGFIVSPEFAPLDPEQRNRMMQVLGLDDWEKMPSASWATQCETCLGYGRVKTGSNVQGRETTGCEDCGESGWKNTRRTNVSQLAPVHDEAAVTGPTVYPEYEPDPRVDALRADGFMVVKLPPPAVSG